MKILNNKGTYDMPPIGSKWICKSATDNTHFSRDKPFKVVDIVPCDGKEEGRCIFTLHSTEYYKQLKDSLEEGYCADVRIVYKYGHSGLSCSQCYHTFIDGAEPKH